MAKKMKIEMPKGPFVVTFLHKEQRVREVQTYPTWEEVKLHAREVSRYSFTRLTRCMSLATAEAAGIPLYTDVLAAENS